MANERRLQKEKRAKKMKGLRDFYYAGKSNIENAASESSCEDEDDDEVDVVESADLQMDLKVGDKVIAPATTSKLSR